MNTKNNKRKVTQNVSIMLAILIMFTLIFNMIPVYASSESNECIKKDVCETMVVTIAKDNMIPNTTPNFKIDYREYPYTMTFTISGVKNFPSKKVINSLKETKFVSDVYNVITLDDSMIRFNVVFNTPVKYNVKEYKDPYQIVTTLMKDKNVKEKPMYSVRTASYPNGEKIGVMEERIGSKDARILKDEKGNFLVEAGIFKNQSKAEEKVKKLNKKIGNEFKFYIEKRGPGEIPKPINE